jgi:hypothetical protein
MRCQWAASRGEDAAARFIEENRLQPIEAATRFGHPGASTNALQPNGEAKSSTKFPCMSRE